MAFTLEWFHFEIRTEEFNSIIGTKIIPVSDNGDFLGKIYLMSDSLISRLAASSNGKTVCEEFPAYYIPSLFRSYFLANQKTEAMSSADIE